MFGDYNLPAAFEGERKSGLDRLDRSEQPGDTPESEPFSVFVTPSPLSSNCPPPLTTFPFTTLCLTSSWPYLFEPYLSGFGGVIEENRFSLSLIPGFWMFVFNTHLLYDGLLRPAR